MLTNDRMCLCLEPGKQRKEAKIDPRILPAASHVLPPSHMTANQGSACINTILIRAADVIWVMLVGHTEVACALLAAEALIKCKSRPEPRVHRGEGAV